MSLSQDSTSDLQERLIELETRVAFQEDTLNELNSVITRQDQEIIRLRQQVALMAKRLDDYMYTQEQGSARPDQERPPHY
ncbi:SlyX family protein [Cellvibrio polysaccharolyticus]|uniref:Protein SlyX homolog n=1 Tax=Cellvibrio polysaccharolyticus TaxID=2082724 RepID=A0A928V4C6_9GAMM|nr:SlyX family protein [Cellvibrio polysaccharolyticus]MBE8718042.1 homocysteine methyltransferase [Cellvibrio polysaccharolyticus]